VVGNPQNLVDPLVLCFRGCPLADADSLAVAGGQYHRDDLMGGELFPQRGSGGVDALIQESLLHRCQQMIGQHTKFGFPGRSIGP
jgi:hypothetical protein